MVQFQWIEPGFLFVVALVVPMTVTPIAYNLDQTHFLKRSLIWFSSTVGNIADILPTAWT